MIKRTVTYTDYNDKVQTEDCYFNLNKIELFELSLKYGDDLPVILKKMVEEEDFPGIYDAFKTILHKGYGQKSEDGRSFLKDEKKTREFEQSAAYEQLVMDLLTDKEGAEKFLLGMMPSDVANGSVAPAIS